MGLIVPMKTGIKIEGKGSIFSYDIGEELNQLLGLVKLEKRLVELYDK